MSCGGRIRMPREYVVWLAVVERMMCEDTVNWCSHASQKACRARILLHTDSDVPDPPTGRETASAGPLPYRCCRERANTCRPPMLFGAEQEA